MQGTGSVPVSQVAATDPTLVQIDQAMFGAWLRAASLALGAYPMLLPGRRLARELLAGKALVRRTADRKSRLKMGTRVTLREADRVSKTVCRSEVNSNCRYRFVNSQTTSISLSLRHRDELQSAIALRISSALGSRGATGAN